MLLYSWKNSISCDWKLLTVRNVLSWWPSHLGWVILANVWSHWGGGAISSWLLVHNLTPGYLYSFPITASTCLYDMYTISCWLLVPVQILSSVMPDLTDSGSFGAVWVKCLSSNCCATPSTVPPQLSIHKTPYYYHKMQCNAMEEGESVIHLPILHSKNTLNYGRIFTVTSSQQDCWYT